MYVCMYVSTSGMSMVIFQKKVILTKLVMFWPFDPAKNAIHGDAPEGGDTF